MENEIKSCPFCNVEAHMLVDRISPYIVAYTPECMNPKCCATMGRFCTEKEAIQAWNNRTAPADNRIKELECQLEAWHKVFGTSQLSHAQARLEKAERNAPAGMVRLDEEEVIKTLHDCLTEDTYFFQDDLYHMARDICEKFASPQREISTTECEICRSTEHDTLKCSMATVYRSPKQREISIEDISKTIRKCRNENNSSSIEIAKAVHDLMNGKDEK